MKRRLYLTLAASTISAGCSTVSTIRQTSPNTTIAYEPNATFKSVDVGSRERVKEPDTHKPHIVGIWNASEYSREFNIQVRNDEKETFSLEEIIKFPTNSELRLNLLEPAKYTIDVRTVESGTHETIQIKKERFDCNYSRHNIKVLPRGGIVTTSSGTLIRCDRKSQNSE